mmetsp:Transcript_2078/g.2591  ORF Transcript_2078/g.2591 Transcript_2078/m.2591 type:complete len:110 (-) Transcript_2078:516-845(-)
MKVTMKKTMIILLKFKNNLFFQVYIYIHIFYCLALLVQSSQDLCLLSIEGIKIFKNNREKKRNSLIAIYYLLIVTKLKSELSQKCQFLKEEKEEKEGMSFMASRPTITS